ncbi:hypothetical protein C3Z06_09330 [Cupriavidus metallidurans]|nr:hypothetical protein C3Z06_09330 [Cupriavidus metallidurans]
MLKRIRCWYQGEWVIESGSLVGDTASPIWPSSRREYHWTARTARFAVEAIKKRSGAVLLILSGLASLATIAAFAMN